MNARRLGILASFAISLGVVSRTSAQQTIADAAASPAATRAAEALLDRRISIDLSGVPLKRAIDAAMLNARVPVQYQAQVIDAYGKSVTLRLVNVPLRTVLDQLLAGTMLRVVPDGTNKLMIVDRPASAGVLLPQATGTLTGRVFDSASGDGITNATVAINSTRLAAVTNATGQFSITNVPSGEQAVTVKALGYASVIRSVRIDSEQPTTVRILMRQTTHILSGVVTTATGNQQKREIGNSIVSLNVDSIMQVAPITNVTDLLEARVPGMVIQRTSGTPGDPARIRLRGTSSIDRNNDPIIIVDGVRMYSQTSDERNRNDGMPTVGSGTTEQAGTSYATPSPLDQIDPSSIEKIEVLKGPSASAMYGSDAANGVIVITTKRGQSGPARWSVALNQGISYMPGQWPTSYYKWVTPLVGGFPQVCYGYCGDSRVDSIIPFQALNEKRLTALGRGSETSGNVTVSGGSQAVQYSFTISGGNTLGILKLPEVEAERYLKFQGVPAPDWMRRPDHLEMRSASGRTDVALNRKANFSVMTTLSQQIQRRTSMSNSVNTAISQLQSKWVDLSQLAEQPMLGNPYERVTSANVNMINAVTLNVLPAAWLPINTTVGMNTFSRDNENQVGRDLLPAENAGGVWSGSTQRSTEVTGMSYTRVPLHRRLTLALGLNYTKGTTNDQRGGFRGFAEGIGDPSGGTDASGTSFQRSTSERNSFGWYVEPQLNVRSRFFVMPGFRLDNNGLSGKNAKFNGLPKMNFSWIASEEGFFPFKETIGLLRLRTAFGVAGVQPDARDVTRLYEIRTVNPFQGISTEYGDMLSLAYLGNTRLRPERGVEVEGGFDTELWNGRVSFEVTHYRKRRIDAIVSSPYATSADGGGRLKLNLGDIDNTGTEIGVNARILERRAIGLNVGTTMTRYRSKIVRLGADGFAIASGNNDFISDRYVVGYPMEGEWARPIIGVVDIDGDGWISASEVSAGAQEVFIGSEEPNFQLALHPDLTVLSGRLRVSASLSYVSGQFQNIVSTLGAPLQNLIWGINDPSTDLNTQAAFIAREYALSSVGMLQKVSVLRLQSLSVNVNLGQRAARLVRARSASLALQGSNLGLWTNYMGVDPNVNAISTGQNIRDTGQQPQPRTWRLRLALGF